jgi:hypothetical protein
MSVTPFSGPKREKLRSLRDDVSRVSQLGLEDHVQIQEKKLPIPEPVALMASHIRASPVARHALLVLENHFETKACLRSSICSKKPAKPPVGEIAPILCYTDPVQKKDRNAVHTAYVTWTKLLLSVSVHASSVLHQKLFSHPPKLSSSRRTP